MFSKKTETEKAKKINK